MKSNLSFLIFLFVCLLTVSGCKKDDEPLTKTDILTAKAWKFQDLVAFGQNLTTLGVGSFLGPVANSDFKFNRDGTYVATNRTTNASAPGKWEFDTNETKLILDKGTSSESTFDILTLTDKNLDLRLLVDKTSIDVSQLPENIRALYIFAPASIPVDVKLVPAS